MLKVGSRYSKVAGMKEVKESVNRGVARGKALAHSAGAETQKAFRKGRAELNRQAAKINPALSSDVVLKNGRPTLRKPVRRVVGEKMDQAAGAARSAGNRLKSMSTKGKVGVGVAAAGTIAAGAYGAKKLSNKKKNK